MLPSSLRLGYDDSFIYTLYMKWQAWGWYDDDRG
jgi:hypothetical protein